MTDLPNFTGKDMMSELFGIPYERIDSLMMQKATKTCPSLYYYCPFYYVSIKSARALPKFLNGDPQHWQKVCTKQGRTIWRCLDGNKFFENTHFYEIEDAEWFVGPLKHPGVFTRYIADKGHEAPNPFLEDIDPCYRGPLLPPIEEEYDH